MFDETHLIGKGTLALRRERGQFSGDRNGRINCPFGPFRKEMEDKKIEEVEERNL